jgi:hypothetical protein
MRAQFHMPCGAGVSPADLLSATTGSAAGETPAPQEPALQAYSIAFVAAFDHWLKHREEPRLQLCATGILNCE